MNNHHMVPREREQDQIGNSNKHLVVLTETDGCKIFVDVSRCNSFFVFFPEHVNLT